MEVSPDHELPNNESPIFRSSIFSSSSSSASSSSSNDLSANTPTTEETSALPFEIIMNGRRGTSGLQIKLQWDTTVTNETWRQFVRAGAQILVNVLTTKAIHDVIVFSTGVGLGSSDTSLFSLASYDAFRQMYAGHMNGNATRTLTYQSNMPTTDPFAGLSPTWFITATGAQAFQVDTSGSTPAPNQMHLNFNLSDTYDMVGVVQHELSESLGRIGGFVDGGTTFRTIMDLCSYSGPNVRTAQYANGANFSTDAGTTLVSEFNTDPSGDWSDWSSKTLINDCCNAFAGQHVRESFSSYDMTVMETMGWDPAPVQYSLDSFQFPPGVPITMANNYTPLLACTFSIAPDLPTGLSMDTTTGIISGTPVGTSGVTNYTVKLDGPPASMFHVEGTFQMEIAEPDDGGLSSGAITGIILASIVFILLLAFLLYQSIHNYPKSKPTRRPADNYSRPTSRSRSSH